MRRSGFTLIELLVVIAVIGLLAGLLFTGVLGLVKQGRNAANKDNEALLSAAIMEYWHDQGRWPIPKGHKPKKVGRKTVYDSDSEGGDIQETAHEVYEYKLVYGKLDKNGRVTSGYNNSEIVKILLSAKVKSKGGAEVEKQYLDLGPFVTCPYEDGTDADSAQYPIDEVIPAGGLEEKAKSGQVKVPLLYRSQFMQCPHCKKLYPVGGGRRTCGSRSCPDYEANHKQFDRFKAAELKGNFEGAKPYVISFDFINNKCDVTMP